MKGIAGPQLAAFNRFPDQNPNPVMRVSHDGELIYAGLEVRIGMHVGPAVAGVIGLKKFIYDVWGDTVNVASRMETLSEPGHLQVTESTHRRLQEAFDFEPRGTIEVKGLGPTATYYLLGRRQAG